MTSKLLFVEIIESVKGIVPLGEIQVREFNIKKFSGLQGNLVLIDISDDDLDSDEGKGILERLGLSNLIATLFPDAPPHPNDENYDEGGINPDNVNDVFD